MSKKIVIIGAGLSGLSISKELSKNKVSHILIGKAPNKSPKLGESMNPEGTTELINFYPEHKKFFYPKKFTIIGVGKNRIHCNFSKIGRLKAVSSILNFVSPGLTVPKDLIHIDRSNFDYEVFKNLKDNPYLTHIDDLVSNIEYDQSGDEISSISLKSGRVIETSHVFDASNHARIIGKATKQNIQTLSAPQEVTFAHYNSERMDSNEECDWHHSTNLLRLTEKEDGVSGFAWCIPLKSYISVGISIDKLKAQDYEKSPEDTMELLRLAYKRRGLDFQKYFNQQIQINRVTNQYFTYDKACGKNWLLAGPAYSQIWYMSGSGVACSLVAAYMAKRFIDNPIKEGKKYQNYMDEYLRTHRTIDWFVETDTNNMDDKKFNDMTSRWLMSNIERMIQYPLLRNKVISNVTSYIAAKLIKYNLVTHKFFSFHKYCPVEVTSQPLEQWGPSAITVREKRESREQIVKELFTIISNKKPIKEIDHIMHKYVNLWMDKKPFWGRWFWKTWVSYIQSQTGIQNLTLTVEKFEHRENYVNIRARWSAVKSGELSYSDDVIGRCYFKENKLARIESKAINYNFIFNKDLKSQTSFILLVANVICWKFIKIITFTSNKEQTKNLNEVFSDIRREL